MHRSSIALEVTAAAVILIGQASAAFAGYNLIDARTCVKVKDLKAPAAITYATNPASVTAENLGPANSCTLIKLSTICLVSDVAADTGSDDGSQECCFKAKCDAKFIPNSDTYTVNDNGTGAGTISGGVSLKSKPSLICIPCHLGV